MTNYNISTNVETYQDCEILEYNQNIKDGLCLQCNGSGIRLDSTKCEECNGYGVIENED